MVNEIRTKNGYSKIAEAEARVGIPLDEYFKDAMARGLTQGAMALELLVSRQTVNKWMQRRGWQVVLHYRKRRAA